MDGSSGRKKRKRTAKAYNSAATDSEDDQFDLPTGSAQTSVATDASLEDEIGKTRSKPVVIVDTGFSTIQGNPDSASTSNVSYIGSALKKAPDGTVAPPRVIKRKSKVNTVRRVMDSTLSG